MQKRVNIVLTGGHAATMGISVVGEIKRRFPGATISFIGSRAAIPGTKATTIEYKIYPDLGVNYYSILAGKLQTKFTRYTIPLALMVPIGFIQSFFLLLKIRPRVVLSFGGFASFPVVVWSYVFRIPVVLHEQTVVFGRASKASIPFVQKIALARAESLNFFPKDKCVITGNPLLPDVAAVKPKSSLGKPATIFVNVGSRGSEFIGDEVFKILPGLLEKYEVYHIAGENLYGRYNGLKNKQYHLFSYIDPREIGKYYRKADIILARAGASTISEILHVKRPAIVIPLPRTFMDEQYKNAKYAEDFGIAKVMKEDEVNSKSLSETIEETFSNWQKIVDKVAKKPSPDTGASRKVVDVVSEFL